MRALWRWRYLIYLAAIITTLVLLIIWFNLDSDPTMDNPPGDKYAIAAMWVFGVSVVGATILEIVRQIHLWPYKTAWVRQMTPEQRMAYLAVQAAKTGAIIYGGEKLNKGLKNFNQKDFNRR